MYDKVVQVEDFIEGFEGNIPESVADHILKLDLHYRDISEDEFSAHKQKYLDFLDETIIESGPKRQGAWEKGWGQNLSDVLEGGITRETLLPYYYKRGVSLMRYKGKFILPEDQRFEAKFLSVIQLALAEKYFKDFDNIYELGCGPCHNIFEFALNTKNKNYHVTDWVEPSIKIANLLEEKKHDLGIGTHNFSSQIFNLFEEHKTYTLEPNSILLTFGSMEQLGDKFTNLLDFFLQQDCKNFIHLEPIMETYDRNNEIDDLAYRYADKRNYLKGFLPKLQELEEQSIIKINCCNKLIGSGFHDGWTFLRWEKI